MDGRNSFGRRISLLNDSPEELVHHHHDHGRGAFPKEFGPAFSRLSSSLTFPLPFRHSRTSSYASSTPLSSPPTPQLVRSDSSDSSNMNRTPSPITPSFDFNSLGVAQGEKAGDTVFAQHNNFFPTHPSVPNYPPIPSQHAPHFYPGPPALAPQPSLFEAPPPPADVVEVRSQSSASKVIPKKNQYACPLAKQYACSDYFTTSGHAARHAKKHTGKKDAFCPECNKAFTRKDNMEQHRRTHQNGRTSSKVNGEGSSSKRQKTTSRRSDKSQQLSQPQQSQPPPPSMTSLDPSLAESPASSFGFPETSFAPVAQASTQMYPTDLLGGNGMFMQTPYSSLGPFDPALNNISGLEQLAMAASKRNETDF